MWNQHGALDNLIVVKTLTFTLLLSLQAAVMLVKRHLDHPFSKIVRAIRASGSVAAHRVSVIPDQGA